MAKKTEKEQIQAKTAENDASGLTTVDELKSISTKLPKLTNKQKRFCEEYTIDLNATQAAIRAGYAANSVNAYRVIGCHNLMKVNVQAEIQRRIAERSERTQVTADNVVLELAKLGFSNIKNYLNIEDDEVYFKDFSEITDEQAAAVESIKVMKKIIKGKGENDDDVEIQAIQFKLHSKTNTLEQLGKHLGIYQKDKVIDVGQNLQNFIDWLIGRNGDPEDTSRNRPLLTR